jgi:hypothetical protein
MGRRSKIKQAFAFPVDSESLDAAVPSSSPEVDKVVSESKKKKEIQSAVAAIPEIFTPEQVVWVFDVYVAILSFVYSLVLKSDFKAISSELSMEEAEKQTMAKPLARVLSKYAPSEWAGMQPEIELITCMGIWTVTSYKRAQSAALKFEESERKRKNAESKVMPQVVRQQNQECAVTL